jgi:hypothetical protein
MLALAPMNERTHISTTIPTTNQQHQQACESIMGKQHTSITTPCVLPIYCKPGSSFLSQPQLGVGDAMICLPRKKKVV